MENSLSITNLVKKYGNTIALNHVSLQLKPGIYGLLGQNGAGKTTLLNCMTCLSTFDEGQILWNNQPINELKKEYRSILGYMPQYSHLDVDFTVIGFLYYMAALKEIENPQMIIEKILHSLHLNEYRKRKLNQLSGGMKQRVLIGQALLNNPELLLLDEPTAGLDPVERRNLRKIISSFSKDKIVLLATHVISDVEFISDEIIMMQRGKILTVATQEALMQKTKVYETDMSEAELLEYDPNAKIVNQHFHEGKLYTRFISKLLFNNRVETTLNDVYLDWLGNND